jgi:hypothetical protein
LRHMSEQEIEKYVQAFRKLEREGVDLRSLYVEGITAVIGETGTSAIVFHLGDKVFLNPDSFVRRLFQIFGAGSLMLFDRMVSQAANHKNSREPHATKDDEGDQKNPHSTSGETRWPR